MRMLDSSGGVFCRIFPSGSLLRLLKLIPKQLALKILHKPLGISDKLINASVGAFCQMHVGQPFAELSEKTRPDSVGQRVNELLQSRLGLLEVLFRLAIGQFRIFATVPSRKCQDFGGLGLRLFWRCRLMEWGFG